MCKIIFIIFCTVILFEKSNAFLVVPATSPTRHQLIAGLGVPLNLENEAVTYGWTLKAQYFLPESTAEDLKFVNFPGVFLNYTGNPDPNVQFAVNTISQKGETSQQAFPNGRRRKREILYDKNTKNYYEVYDVEVKEAGKEELKSDENNIDDENTFDDEFNNEGMIPKLRDYPKAPKEELMDTSGTRWLLYDGMGKLLTSKGSEGRICMMRAICEAAENNFGYHNGLLGQLFHVFFTPSSTDDKITNKDHYDYIKAEMVGRAGESCANVFYQCKKSIMEIFTQVHHSPFFNFQ